MLRTRCFGVISKSKKRTFKSISGVVNSSFTSFGKTASFTGSGIALETASTTASELGIELVTASTTGATASLTALAAALAAVLTVSTTVTAAVSGRESSGAGSAGLVGIISQLLIFPSWSGSVG